MITVLDADESASIDDARLGLTELNDLMANLSGEGIDLGFPPQDSLSDDFPLDETTEARIKPVLAMALMSFYPSAKPIDTLPTRFENAMNGLRRDAALANMEEATMTHVPLGEGYSRGASILTDG